MYYFSLKMYHFYFVKKYVSFKYVSFFFGKKNNLNHAEDTYTVHKHKNDWNSSKMNDMLL